LGTPAQGYRVGGERVPSVTTILSRFKDSGSLIKWAYRQGREHESLAARGLPCPRDLYDKSATTAKAALSGTIAHDMIETYILGEHPPANADIVVLEVSVKHGWGSPDAPDADVFARARNGFMQFLKWMSSTRLQVTHTEMQLTSDLHRFGGTLDAVGVDEDGVVVLIDWKTSNAVYADYLYQLAGYSLLLEEKRPELAPKAYHLLRFAKESADFAHHYFGELDNEKRAFLLMRELYEIDARTRKRA
jgi:hypothetical protein